MLYFLKFQKNTNEMIQAWSPSAKKLDKKAVFSSCCGDKATTYYDRANKNVRSMSLGEHTTPSWRGDTPYTVSLLER